MMPTYITADTHFGHLKLAEVFKDRPTDFQERILISHNKLPPECTLIHLGDFCIGRDELLHNFWNEATKHIARRILVRGNHDNKSDTWYYKNGWDFVCSSFIAKNFGQRILFSHIPKDHTHYPYTQLNIHGHTHGNTHRDLDITDIYDPAYHIEIALEHSNYQPILFNDKLVKKEDVTSERTPGTATGGSDTNATS